MASLDYLPEQKVLHRLEHPLPMITIIQGIICLENFEYTIYNYFNDWIIDIVSAYANDERHLLIKRSTPVYQETSSQDANVRYNLTFIHFGSYGEPSSDDIYTTFGLYVGDNDFSVYISD